MTDNISIFSHQLSKIFIDPNGKPFSAVNNLSLSIKKGELTAFVGSDGAGKTTLMRMIAGLLMPDAGRLEVLGIQAAQNPQDIQNRISYMPQRFGLYEDLSVMENLSLYADLHAVPQQVRHERFERMLNMTGMMPFTKRLAGQLSGGMKQKLGLACTLVRSPDLLLLDEPSVGVDPLSRRDLWKIIQQLVEEEQLSVIISTAYMDEAQRCQRVFIMHEGQLLATGSPNQLKQQARGLTYVAYSKENQPARFLQAQLIDANALILDAIPKGGDVHFICQPNTSKERLHTFLHDIHYQPRPEEFEDAFMMFLRRQDQSIQTLKSSALISTASMVKAQANTPAIVVRDLIRKFGDFTAVANTSFTVNRGEIFGLLGPNGAGKTTTFRMLCGLLPATSGQLDVAGVNLRLSRAKARSRLGYVSQKFALYANLSIADNLAFFGGAYGLTGKKLTTRIQAMLQQFELEPNAISGALSNGYKQRLAMAVGLLHEPEILFLDEPTSGIDPIARRAFWRTITELALSGVTIIITTHFMEEAEYCDRIAIQDAGKMLALGTPHAIRVQANNQSADMNDAFISIVEQHRHFKPTSIE